MLYAGVHKFEHYKVLEDDVHIFVCYISVNVTERFVGGCTYICTLSYLHRMLDNIQRVFYGVMYTECCRMVYTVCYPKCMSCRMVYIECYPSVCVL